MPARDLSIGISGEGADELSAAEDNLAWKAAVLLAERAGVEPSVRLDLVKGIPVAAGLAGGSADAAATLVACDALWGTGLARAELLELAAELGSDVAFALTGGTALGTGRGERLTPVLAGGRWHWVLAVAGEGLSTPDVYGELDRLRAATEQPAAGERRPADQRAAGARPGRARPAAGQRPAGRRRWRCGRSCAARCGSGSTSARSARSSPAPGRPARSWRRSREAAVRLAAALAGTGVGRTVRVAYGPVPGARVVADEEGS